MRCEGCGDDFAPDQLQEEHCRLCWLQSGQHLPGGEGDDEEYGAAADWDDSNEPCGSCEWCGTNLYPHDLGLEEELCDQCLWHAEQNEGGEDSGIQPIV